MPELYVIRLTGSLHITESIHSKRPILDSFPMPKKLAEGVLHQRELVIEGRSRSKIPYHSCGVGELVKVG